MNAAVTQMLADTDRITAAAIKRSGITPPCCAGCFACCKEPLLTSRQEVRNMLESLTVDQRDHVEARTMKWSIKFLDSGEQNRADTNSFAYRSFNIYCPFLEDGKCVAYEHRPLDCRMFIALENPKACEDDELRKTQKFAEFPGLVAALMQSRMSKMQDGETDALDHLGLLLAEEFTGKPHESRSRIKVECSQDNITVTRYGED